MMKALKKVSIIFHSDVIAQMLGRSWNVRVYSVLSLFLPCSVLVSPSSTPCGRVDADCSLSRELSDSFLASRCLTGVCVCGT